MRLGSYFTGGITPGTVRANKALVPDDNKDLSGLRNLTVTGNIVSSSQTISPTELGYLDGAGLTVVASKAVIADADKDIVGVRKIWLGTNGAAGFAGELDIQDGANPGASAALSYADLLKIDAITDGVGAAGKAVVLDSNGRVRLPSTGTVFNAGKETKAQAAPAAKTVTAGITAAELVAGLITTTGVTAPSIHQLPTGTEIDAAIPGIATGDAFDFTIINTGTGASDDAIITVNTDVTIVGNPTVGALTDATIISGSGRFRARRSAANTYVVYRMA